MSVLTDITARRVYAVELMPYDPATDATVTLYGATSGFTTSATDTPAHTFFEPVINNALTYSRSMFEPNKIGGRSMPDPGVIEIINVGGFDEWLGYIYDGRAATVKVGYDGDDYTDFETLFTGVCGEIEYQRNLIRIPIFDKQDRLDKLIQENHYAGTGGNEGDEDLEGKPKPVLMGECLNVTAIYVDRTSYVFQVHDGAINAIDAVYDQGKLLTLTTDYTVDLSNGRFTLTAAPAGVVTADVKGSATGAAYVSSVADIVERIVKDYGGFVSGELDTVSFADLNTANSAKIGFYTATTERNILDVLDEVCLSIGAFYTVTRTGKFRVARFEAPAGAADKSFEETDLILNQMVRDSGGAITWRQRVQYGIAWTVQYADNLDPAATDAHKSFIAEPYRVASVEDTDIKEDGVGKSGFINAVDLEPLQTLLVEEADAATEAARLLTLYRTRRDRFLAPVKTSAFDTELGDVVEITHSRFGLSGSKKFTVVGMDERAAENQIDLELWG